MTTQPLSSCCKAPMGYNTKKVGFICISCGKPCSTEQPKTYARDYSHIHCFDQKGQPPCGIPLEKHTQCCLCDVKYPVEQPIIDLGIKIVDHPPVSTGYGVEGKAHIHCFARKNPHRCASCCECGESFRNATNKTPVNASAVEEQQRVNKIWSSVYMECENMKVCIKKVGNQWNVVMEGERQEVIVDITNLFTTHASTLSDSTLREVLVEVGEDCVASSERGEGVNQERQRIRAIINKRLEK